MIVAAWHLKIDPVSLPVASLILKHRPRDCLDCMGHDVRLQENNHSMLYDTARHHVYTHEIGIVGPKASVVPPGKDQEGDISLACAHLYRTSNNLYVHPVTYTKRHVEGTVHDTSQSIRAQSLEQLAQLELAK